MRWVWLVVLGLNLLAVQGVQAEKTYSWVVEDIKVDSLKCSGEGLRFDLEVAPFFFQIMDHDINNSLFLTDSQRWNETSCSDEKVKLTLHLVSLDESKSVDVLLISNKGKTKIQFETGEYAGISLSCENVQIRCKGEPLPASNLL